MRKVTSFSALLVLSTLTLAGCGSSDAPPGEGDAAPATGALLPWKVGNTWTYRVTDDGEVTQKVTTIEEETVVGGTGPHAADNAYQVTTKKKDGNDETISWQIDDGDKVVRYREQSFSASTGDLSLEEHWDPYKLHIDGTDAHTRAGASWLEEYQETKMPTGEASSTADARDRWIVDGVGEEVTVPAGTFGDCIVFQKAGGDSLKSYWYVRGIGKIKETGSQTEELVDYSLQP
jgi:hypothetical protein